MENTTQFNAAYDELLKQKYEKYGARIAKHLSKKENQYLIDYIYSATAILDKSYTLGHRLYWIFNKITDFPKCPVCGKPIRENVTIKNGYTRTYCSYTCLNNSPEKQDKVKKTCLEHYGVENPFAAEEIKQQIRDVSRERFGADSYFSSELYKKRKRERSLEKYGVDDPFKSEEFRKTLKQNMLKKYGVENPFAAEEIKQKIKNTMLQRYGYEHALNCPQFKDKLIKRHLQGIIDFCNTIKNDFVEYLGYFDGIFRWKCKKCQNIFETKKLSTFSIGGTRIYARCEKCYPMKYSKPSEENDLCIQLKNYAPELQYIRNNRTIIKPKELDIYIPEKKLAIEFNGLYWHSSASDRLITENLKTYHLNKTEECEKLGIHLVHVFEDEWMNKQDIVLSRLFSMLKPTNRIFARKCTIKEVDKKTACLFVDENHIQGSINSKINIGLYYNNELVSLMTFGKSRFNKKYEWELLRFCSKKYTSVVGAAGKILRYFEKTYKPNSLISYADRRWSNGNVYKKIGFTLKSISGPSYYYVDDNFEVRQSRFKYQKHKLKKLLQFFDPNLSEQQNMIQNNYNVIYDCGNLVFVKEYNLER